MTSIKLQQDEQVIRQLVNVENYESIKGIKTPEQPTFATAREKISPSAFIKNKTWKLGFNRLKKSNKTEKSRDEVIEQTIPKRKPPPLPNLNENRINEFFPSRQSSLPRPTSVLFQPNKHLNLRHQPVPDEKFSNIEKNTYPMNKTHYPIPTTSNRNKKSFVDVICTLCKELVSNRAHGEKIIELRCGHTIHEDCLSISFGNVSDYNINDNYSLFPKCISCWNEDESHRRCIPIREETKDKFISNFLLNNGLSPIEQSFEIDSQIITETISPSLSPIQQLDKIHKFPNSRTSSPLPMYSAQNPSIPTFASADSYSYLINPIQSKINLFHKDSHFGSSVYAESEIISSTQDTESLYTVGTNEVQFTNKEDNQNTASIPILRSYFTDILFTKFSLQINKSSFDEEYGLLRLVDSFSTSVDGISYYYGHCHLFENSIILSRSNKNIEKNEKQESISGNSFNHVEIFNLSQGFTIDTIDSSVLKIEFYKPTTYGSSKLYLTENLETKSSSFIEKWISGLLDTNLTFDESHFTSTLDLPPILKNNESDNLGTTYFSLVNPNKIIEVTHLDFESSGTIVRRSIMIPNDNSLKFSEDSLRTVMTSFSSIIAMKKEPPQELVVILQLDFKKLSDGDYLVIMNTIKALQINYANLYVCFIDSKGDLIKYSSFKNALPSINDLKDLQYSTTISKFSPSILLNELSSSDINTSLGLAVISNTMMNETESVLFKSFTDVFEERSHRIHQIKIHVGFLNIDYSEHVQELLEINNWSLVLESLCFAFGIVFGQDEDTYDNTLNYNSTPGSEAAAYTLSIDSSSIYSIQDSLTTLLLESSSPSTGEVSSVILSSKS